MSIRPIYLFGNEVLRAKAKPVKDVDNSILKLVFDIVETMHNAKGIGLAANQVGELQRVIVIDLAAVEEAERESSPSDKSLADQSQKKPREAKTLVIINPEILEQQGSWVMEEGCLSIPDARADVERSEKVRVRFRDANFKEVEMSADGLLSRVMLHEIDHLNGVLFIDHLSVTQRGLLKPKLRRIKKGEVETAYPVIGTPSRAAAFTKGGSRRKVEV